VHGRETGQWREADLAVAHWLQHTSRDGDMQLHVHSQIAHVARTATDGKWRAPDSLGYNEHIGAVAAIVSQRLEEALTARFGLEWVARDDGHGFEIKGVSGEMSQAAQRAVALAQQEKSAWTRADLIKYLGRVLPRSGRDPAAAAALLEDLADRVLRSQFEPVACLEAPEPAEVPRRLADDGLVEIVPSWGTFRARS
jgi:hypothetical protein